MGWTSFGASVAFALGSALLLPAFWLGLAPLLGGATALSIYLAGVAVVYVTGLGRRNGLRWWAAGLTACGAVALLTLSTSLVGLAIGAALLVAGGRAMLFASRPLRQLAIEALLATVGLAAAASVAGSGPISIAFALCAYLLVQSGFFLIAEAAAPRVGDPEDGFERARDRLLRLLDSQLG